MRSIASVTPNGASVSSVGGWNDPARWSSVSAGSASITRTGTPWCASESAVASPPGPAPTMTTGERIGGFYNPRMSDCIDIHTHIVPENFPAYAGKGRDVPWPAMAEGQDCHRHMMISGRVYRTVADGSWSVPRRIEAMATMRVARQALSPMPELLSYWLPLEGGEGLIRYLNE